MAKKENRESIALQCTVCKNINYLTSKNKQNTEGQSSSKYQFDDVVYLLYYLMIQPDAALHDSLKKEMNREQRVKIHDVIDRTINSYKRTQYFSTIQIYDIQW